MPRAELGTSRFCLHCSVRFYDLNQNLAICPKCKKENDYLSLNEQKSQMHTETEEVKDTSETIQKTGSEKKTDIEESIEEDFETTYSEKILEDEYIEDGVLEGEELVKSVNVKDDKEKERASF